MIFLPALGVSLAVVAGGTIEGVGATVLAGGTISALIGVVKSWDRMKTMEDLVDKIYQTIPEDEKMR